MGDDCDPVQAPLLDEWHRQDWRRRACLARHRRVYQLFRSLPWSRRGVPEMGHGRLPRQQNPDQSGTAPITTDAARQADDKALIMSIARSVCRPD
jgi:hypothetical protein